MTAIHPYRYHADQPRCKTVEIRVDGVLLDVLVSGTTAIATCAVDGPCRVEVRRMDGALIAGATVHPIQLGIVVAPGNPGVAAFALPGPQRVLIHLPGGPELLLLADPIAEEPPTGRRVLRFEAGKIHEVGKLALNDGDTLWIEGGAVLRGRLHVKNATDVTVCGRGVFDGIDFIAENPRPFYLVFDHCRQVAVRDLLVINSPCWQMVFGACENVTVNDVKEVGYVSGSDGIDMVGSSHVRVRDCFYRTGDDALVVKSESLKRAAPEYPVQWAGNVEDIEVSGCAIITHGSGAAFEIGHELACDSVRNIRFHDCDVIATHGFGGTFSIRNAGRALVEDVNFERIRVEHSYFRFVDMRVIRSMWGSGWNGTRGRIRNIRFRDIDWKRTKFNPGYTTSEIGGFDAEHLVEDVSFANLRLDGVPIQNLDEIELHTRHCQNIRVEPQR